MVGAGYVGLVAAVCFAKKYDVICVDTDVAKIDMINNGKSPFFEPGLDAMLSEVHKTGKILATTDMDEALLDADFVFISVGTPSLSSGAIDLSFICSAAEGIGNALSKIDRFVVLVQRSTVVPTSTREVVQKLVERASGKTAGKDFGIAFVPEFLREGSAVDDFLNPDRIIIGTENQRTLKLLFQLYEDFYGNLTAEKIIGMSIESAELVKYASNAFIATKISFANEIARIAELIDGVDVVDVMRGVGLDHRVNPKYFNAGAGFGGSCFPKDIKALIHFARTHAFDPILIESVLERNNLQMIHIADLAEDALGMMNDKRITILGLSFKPGTSDMREAPSIKIISELIERGVGEIIACDPIAIPEARKILGERVTFIGNPKEALSGTDCAIIVTEWEIFRKLTPRDFIETMKTPIVIDARRIFPAEEFEKELTYIAVGRRQK